jgi:RNA polymerase sigma factor (sigma-70 family)
VPKYDLDEWFVSAVLPLEPALMRYLRRNCRIASEAADLRQDIYVRVYEAAARELPRSASAFVFATARHLLIDRARREKVVSIEAVADMATLDFAVDELSPERHASARSELRQLEGALQDLPPRCREVVQLRRINGLSQREVAQTMGITEDTVEKQLSKGLRAIAAALLGDGLGALAATLGNKCRKRLKSA